MKFNQKTWVKSYININTEQRKNPKIDFQKDIFKLMNKGVFKRTMEKVRNHRYIKLIATEARRNYVESESNHHTTKIFSDNILARKM